MKQINSPKDNNISKECLELTNHIIRDFPRNEFIDSDSVYSNHRKELVTAIVFFLCYEGKPADFQYIRVRNMLEKAIHQLEIGWTNTALDYMYSDTQYNHNGVISYKSFKNWCTLLSPSSTQMIVVNILNNFNVIWTHIEKFYNQK